MDDGDLIRHHKGGVEAHAELADNIHVRVFLLQLLPELISTAGGDDAQVVLQLVFRPCRCRCR